jgi:hypothetical protein
VDLREGDSILETEVLAVVYQEPAIGLRIGSFSPAGEGRSTQHGAIRACVWICWGYHTIAAGRFQGEHTVLSGGGTGLFSDVCGNARNRCFHKGEGRILGH